MKTMKFIFILVATSMWLFLLHEVLALLPVDRLVWFVYWAYVPVSFTSVILTIVTIIADMEANKKK